MNAPGKSSLLSNSINHQMKEIRKLLLLPLIITANSVYTQNSVLRISESYGPYPVGFSVSHTYDKSRSFGGNSSNSSSGSGKTLYRPMQVCVWYPALLSENKAMLYGDYFYLKAHETGEVELTEQTKKKLITDFLKTDPVDPKILEEELSLPMKAVKDAVADNSNSFPLIIYGPSWWSTAFENALLCEFLASHGYVVISSPSVGPVSREMPISRIGVETQARDMEFLLGQSDKISNADTDKITVAGFSLGGLSNVLMHARNSAVDAWIGLDPSIHEAYEFFEESPYEDYGRFTKPTLFINSMGYMNDLPFYDQLIYSDAHVIDLPQLEHTDLASQFIKLYAPRDQEGIQKRNMGYNLMARYVLNFLDGVFKRSLSYDDFIDQIFSEKHADSSFVKFRSKRGIPTVNQLLYAHSKKACKGLVQYLNTLSSSANKIVYPETDLQELIYLSSENGFNEASVQLMEWYVLNYPEGFHKRVLKYRDFDQMLDMFLAIYKKNKSCNFTYDEINHTAHVLSMSGEGERAIGFFQLNTQLYPDDPRAFFNYGLGYYRIDDFIKAGLNFKKCLDLNPDERYKGLALDFLNKLE